MSTHRTPNRTGRFAAAPAPTPYAAIEIAFPLPPGEQEAFFEAFQRDIAEPARPGGVLGAVVVRVQGRAAILAVLPGARMGDRAARGPHGGCTMTDVYVSIDIETTGPAPGLYSMISLGAAAFTRDGDELGTWSRNLEELPGSRRHPDTMEFWRGQPSAWERARKNAVDPGVAMDSFVAWVEKIAPKPIAAAWPAAFDFAFINWYCHCYVGRNPLGFACLDIRSLAQGLTYSRGYYDLRESQIKALREEVDRAGLTEHVAVDDAIEQGRLLVALLRRTKGGVPKELLAGDQP